MQRINLCRYMNDCKPQAAALAGSIGTIKAARSRDMPDKTQAQDSGQLADGITGGPPPRRVRHAPQRFWTEPRARPSGRR